MTSDLGSIIPTMNDIQTKSDLPPVDPEMDEAITALVHDRAAVEALEAQYGKPDLKTDAFLHGGLCVRTCFFPKGAFCIGAKLKKATVVIISGHMRWLVGTESVDFVGYRVLKGEEGRRGIGVALEDSWSTAIFPTEAATIEEAAKEITDESPYLITERDK